MVNLNPFCFEKRRGHVARSRRSIMRTDQNKNGRAGNPECPKVSNKRIRDEDHGPIVRVVSSTEWVVIF